LAKGRFLGTGLVVAIILIVFDAIVSPSLTMPASMDRSIVLNHYTELQSHLRKAFQSGSVDLQIATYAAETFHQVLSPFFHDVREGQLQLDHLQVRLLLPQYDGPMAVPCIAEPSIEDPERKKTIDDDYKNMIKDHTSNRIRLWQNDLIGYVRIESPMLTLPCVDINCRRVTSSLL
jgi:hypothetical protein